MGGGDDIYGELSGMFDAWGPELPRAERERPYFSKRAKMTVLEMCMAEEENAVSLNWSKIPDAAPKPKTDDASALPPDWAKEQELGIWRVLRALKAEVIADRIHESTATRIYGRMKFMMRFRFEMQFLVASNLDKLEAAGGTQAIVRGVAAAVDDNRRMGRHAPSGSRNHVGREKHRP